MKSGHFDSQFILGIFQKDTKVRRSFFTFENILEVAFCYMQCNNTSLFNTKFTVYLCTNMEIY